MIIKTRILDNNEKFIWTQKFEIIVAILTTSYFLLTLY